MNQSPRKLHPSGRKLLLAGALLLILLTVITIRDPGAPRVSEPSGFNGLTNVIEPPASEPSLRQSPNQTARTLPDRAEEQEMLKALKKWIKRREGKDVRIVESRKVCDPQGRPVELNVLVSGRLDGLTTAGLKASLRANKRREESLKKRLQEAYSRQDTSVVNASAAEFVAARTLFIQTNEFASYKLSLQRSEPPVMAFWKGLSFELLREQEALALAQADLGQDASLANLVPYTSMASLLWFTNSVGAGVAVDPVTLQKVKIVDSGPAQLSATKVKEGRSPRILAQWKEFLDL